MTTRLMAYLVSLLALGSSSVACNDVLGLDLVILSQGGAGQGGAGQGGAGQGGAGQGGAGQGGAGQGGAGQGGGAPFDHLNNPSFENGQLAPWYVQSGTAAVDIVPDGAAPDGASVAHSQFDDLAPVDLRQVFTLPAEGSCVELLVSIKITGGTVIGATAQINTDVGQGVTEASPTLVAGQYRTASVRCEVVGKPATFYVSLTAYAQPASTPELYFDDVHLYDVPCVGGEPPCGG